MGRKLIFNFCFLFFIFGISYAANAQTNSVTSKKKQVASGEVSKKEGHCDPMPDPITVACIIGPQRPKTSPDVARPITPSPCMAGACGGVVGKLLRPDETLVSPEVKNMNSGLPNLVGMEKLSKQTASPRN